MSALGADGWTLVLPTTGGDSGQGGLAPEQGEGAYEGENAVKNAVKNADTAIFYGCC